MMRNRVDTLRLAGGAIGLMLAFAPGADAAALPPTDDPILEKMRSKVDPIMMKTGGGLHDAILAEDQARIAQGHAPQDASMGNSGGVRPEKRTSISMPKGIYYEKDLTQLRDVNLFGATSNPADVEIWSDVKQAGGAIHALGPLYVEGVTLRTEPGPDKTGPKYPLHVTWVERFCRHVHSIIFANCRFVANTSFAGPSGNVMGMDGRAGSYTLFYKCELKGKGTNMHGGGEKDPLTLAYVKCSGTDLVYSDLGVGSADNIYVIDCDFPSVTVSGTNVTLYLSPGSKIGTIRASKVVTTSEWPMPTGGLGPDDRNRSSGGTK